QGAQDVGLRARGYVGALLRRALSEIVILGGQAQVAVALVGELLVGAIHGRFGVLGLRIRKLALALLGIVAEDVVGVVLATVVVVLRTHRFHWVRVVRSISTYRGATPMPS